jgi:FKBP-type peptidyl-prolyl cis-trans isomerase
MKIVAVTVALCLGVAQAQERSAEDIMRDLRISKLNDPEIKCEESEQTANGDTISMQYTGKIAKTGKVFDTSIGRPEPFEFELGAGKVIPGWDYGLQQMCVGEKRRLLIPSELAYGDDGAGEGVIPGGASLDFEVELLKIVPASAERKAEVAAEREKQKAAYEEEQKKKPKVEEPQQSQYNGGQGKLGLSFVDTAAFKVMAIVFFGAVVLMLTKFVQSIDAASKAGSPEKKAKKSGKKGKKA